MVRRLRPVEALQAWLAAASITTGPIFHPVGKGDRVSPASRSAFSAAEIVKHYATRAGLDPSTFAGHSLRCGPRRCYSPGEAAPGQPGPADAPVGARVDSCRGTPDPRLLSPFTARFAPVFCDRHG